MRVAYVHDWLVISGGAEKVAREILNVYPQADVYSLVDFLDKSDREFILRGKRSTTSFIQQLPRARKRYRQYFPLFPLAIEQFDLRKYDLIISSSYAVAKGVLTHADQVHVCYCHSPARYAWDMYHPYLREAKLNRPKRRIARLALHYLRNWDVATANRPDAYIANSDYVKKRIRKIYNRDATVIHPPVDLEAFTPGGTKSDHFVSFSRLVPYKKVDLICEAFRQLPDKKLIVLGGGPDLDRLRKRAPQNVSIRGEVAFKELIDTVRTAQATIVAADEDFGLTPLEAQACGTPVIAYQKGGYLETVKPAVSGSFFQEQTPQSIENAVRKFDPSDFDVTKLQEHAHAFGEERFRQEFRTFVEQTIDSH